MGGRNAPIPAAPIPAHSCVCPFLSCAGMGGALRRNGHISAGMGASICANGRIYMRPSWKISQSAGCRNVGRYLGELQES